MTLTFFQKTVSELCHRKKHPHGFLQKHSSASCRLGGDPRDCRAGRPRQYDGRRPGYRRRFRHEDLDRMGLRAASVANHLYIADTRQGT